MNPINVLYTVNHNYINYLLTSLYSLLENNKNMIIKVNVIHDNFEKEDFKKIEDVVKRFKNAQISFHPFNRIKKNIEKYNIPNWRNTQIANARLFFTEEIKDVDNLLYLDSDTFVVNSLKGLENYNGTINMVKDNMPDTLIKKMDNNIKCYCNSGVLWINVKKWLENDCNKKINDTISKQIKFKFPDQDVLNISLKDDIEILPPEYNLFTTDVYYNIHFLKKFYKQNHFEKYSIEEMMKAKKEPIILHGTPINFLHEYGIKSKYHPYHDIYNSYLEKIYYTDINEKKNYFKKALIDLGVHSKLLVSYETKQKIKKLIKK